MLLVLPGSQKGCWLFVVFIIKVWKTRSIFFFFSNQFEQQFLFIPNVNFYTCSISSFVLKFASSNTLSFNAHILLFLLFYIIIVYRTSPSSLHKTKESEITFKMLQNKTKKSYLNHDELKKYFIKKYWLPKEIHHLYGVHKAFQIQ